MPSRSRRLRRRAAFVWVAVLVLALVLAACSGGSDKGAERTTTSAARRGVSTTSTTTVPRLDWNGCDGGQCARLAVPLDPARPEGPTIELAVFRVQARDRDRRIGSLVLNPGGPGASGVELARNIADQLPGDLRDRFDIVGFDPRGTGSSSPVDCGSNLDYLFDVDTAPDDAAELGALERASERFADACEQRSRRLLPHISTRDTARDMDRLRAALGDDKLTYLGYSYGTYLGSLYAEMFPDRVRALVLDGAVDPTLTPAQVNEQQAAAFGRSLDSFLAWCDGHRSECTFARGTTARAAYEALRLRIERAPITGTLDGERRTLGPTQFDLAVSAAFYGGTAADADLARALGAASRGSPDALLAEFDAYIGRDAGGRYKPDWPAFLAIGCLDGPPVGPLPAWIALQQQAAQIAPDFGAATVGLNLSCAYWPVPPVITTPTAVHAPSAPPIVVVGTTDDPATPLAWARGLATQLGPDTRLVTVAGAQHTSFPNGTSCLDGAVVRYLVATTPPPENLRCG